MARTSSGWFAVFVALAAFLGGVAVCHLALYPTYIVGATKPSLVRWFVVVSPVLVGALISGVAIQSVNDWLASSLAVSLGLQLYEFVAARTESEPFFGSLARTDPAAYWGSHFVGRVVGVAFLLGLSAGAAESFRAYRAWKNSTTKSR